MDSVVCEDAFLSTQLSVFRRFIRSSDVCLQFGHSSTMASLLQFCRELIVVLWNGAHVLWGCGEAVIGRQLRRHFEGNSRVRLVYCPGLE